MPEFENLEPYFDDKGKGRPTPVAPHGGSAHEFQPRRSEYQHRGERTRLRPKKVKLSDSERVTAAQMERDFKAALKAERKHQASRGQSPFRKLLRKIKNWITGGGEKKSQPPRKGRGGRGRQGDRERRGEGRGRPDRRGGKRGDRKPRGEGGPQKGGDRRARGKRRPQKGDGQGPGPGGQRPPQKGGRKQPARQSQKQASPTGPPRQDASPANKASGPAGDQPPPAPSDKSGAPPAKKRRNRRNRNRRTPGDNTGPSSHES